MRNCSNPAIPESRARTAVVSRSETEPHPEGCGPLSPSGARSRGLSPLRRLRAFHVLRLAIAAAVIAATAGAQFRALEVASVQPAAPVKIAPGKRVDVPVSIRIRRGYHINSNKPAETYLIPTRLTWEAPGFKTASIKYPEAEIVKYDFSEKPLSVYSGTIQITSTLTAPTELPTGLTELTGKFRYQACNDKACLPPRTTEFQVPVVAK